MVYLYRKEREGERGKDFPCLLLDSYLREDERIMDREGNESSGWRPFEEMRERGRTTERMEAEMGGH